MPSYITPYSGAGSFLPSGYMQAATAGAQSAARSIEKGADALGDGIAKGIEKYKKNKADDEAVSTMLDTTVPQMRERMEKLANEGDEEAIAFVKMGEKWSAQEMKLSEKKSFAASLMLFQERTRKADRQKIEDGRYETENARADAASAAQAKAREETAKYQDYMRGRMTEEDKQKAEDRAAREAALGAALRSSIVPTQNSSTRQVEEVNPKFTDYQGKVSQGQADHAAAMQNYQQQMEVKEQKEADWEAERAASKDAGDRAAEEKAWEAYQPKLEEAQEALANLSPSWEPDRAKQSAWQRLVVGDERHDRYRKIYDDANEVINNAPRAPRGDLINKPGGFNDYRGMPMRRIRVRQPDAFNLDDYGQAPPKTVTSDVTTFTDFTPQEQRAADLAYINQEMEGQPNSAKMAALQAIQAQRELQDPRVKSINGPNGEPLYNLPTGYVPLRPPVSITDGVALKREAREVRALTVEGYTGHTRTAQQASDFTKELASIDEAQDGIDQLLRIADLPGKSIDFKHRAAAEVIQNTLKGSLRLKIVGPGAMSEKEIELLNSVIANPTKLWALDSSIKESLHTLKKFLTHGNEIAAKRLGLTPNQQAAPDTGEVKKTKSGRSYQVIHE
jgi:hypothetical protein